MGTRRSTSDAWRGRSKYFSIATERGVWATTQAGPESAEVVQMQFPMRAGMANTAEAGARATEKSR